MREFLRRRLGVVIAAVVVLVLLSSTRLAVFSTDWWWFQEVGAQRVFGTILVTRILLTVVFGAVLAVLVAVNLQIARRLRPMVIPETPQQAIIETYRQKADPYLPWLIAAIALVFGITSGLTVSTQWEPFLLWQNAQSFGATDAQFGRDVGYYVFQLPFLRFVQGWLFTSLVLVSLLTVGAHLLLGGIRPDAPRDRVLPRVKAHLSVLLALLLAARGWGYWLDRFMLNFSPRGSVTGASYTDVNAELPALTLLLIVTVVAIVLTLWNLRRQSFLLPGAAVGLLVLASLLLQGVYPAFIQRVRVDPQELARERDYIDRNLAATREAYGLDGLSLEPFEVEDNLDQQQIDANATTFDNVRLWDPELLEQTYQELQALRPFYQFNDVDVDRYVVDGQLRQVMLSARELEAAEVSPQWQNQVLTFTHGFGVVASQVNRADADGEPVFLARDIPPRTNPTLSPGGELVAGEQPGIYFGERGYPPYSIVGTDQPELDYEEPATQQQVTTSYSGAGGVPVDSIGRRLAFAIRFGDPNFVLSNLLNDDSRVLFRREVAPRVKAVAPYLTLDPDPYPVVLDGRILWVQDAYTTSAFYPYSERRFFAAGDDAEVVNYVRNSVKAVVDAYDGTVTLYVADPDDPIVAAWREAFDGALFADLADAPEGLQAHFRYPEYMFRLQAEVYRTYHIPAVDAFYSKADEWELPADAAALQNDPNLQEASTPLRPYYLLMKLPGEDVEEFVLIQPYVPKNKQNMIGWLAARSDPEHYGELFAVQFPTDELVLGPRQAHANIEKQTELSREITVLDDRGSDVIRGDLLVLPVERSLLYVEPLFIQNNQAKIPTLWQVALVMGDRVVVRPTLAGALDALVNGGPAVLLGGTPGDDEPPPDQEPGDEDDPDVLIQRAIEAFRDADEALRAGDLGTYQELVQEAQQLLERAAELRGIEVEPEPSEEPSAPASEPAPSEQASG